MGVHDHKEAAPKRPLNAWVVTVSTSRASGSGAADGSGDLIAKLLSDQGHKVLDRTVVSDDRDAIRTLVRGLAGDGTTELVILTGGTGMSQHDVTAEAIEPLITRPIPGFGELFRMLSFQSIGSAAMLSRATAGMVGPVLLFALPGSPDACRLGMEKLILPEVWHIHHELAKESADLPPAPGAEVVEEKAESKPEKKAKDEPPARKQVEEPKLPPPTGSLGRLGRNTLNVGTAFAAGSDHPTSGGEDDKLPRGWERAVYEIRGEVTKGTYEEIPDDLEKISPVIDVLHTSGERGTMKLPSGRKYVLFGWPNLEKGSKVIAISSGSPVAEVVALHRYPVMTGLLIDESFGLLPKRAEGVTKIAEAVTGRAPKDASGAPYAVQGDAMWIQRGSKAIRWDGHKERDDGTIKQALATLVLDWSSR